MLRGYAYATIASLNLLHAIDSLQSPVQCATVNQNLGVLHSLAISQHYLPAYNERDNEELITHVARRPRGALGVVEVQSSARPRSWSMLVEVSGPCVTASDTLRPKRLPIHIG